jgi:hypothetical protein
MNTDTQQQLERLVDALENQEQPNKDTQRSFLTQPERIFITSDDDISQTVSQDEQTENSFASFTVNLKRPALNVKSLQVSRVSIPNATSSCIPDDECVFWYYRIPSVASTLVPGFKYPTPGLLSASYLYYVRLLPSYYKKDLIDPDYVNEYGYNSVFPDYESLAAELTKACQNDLSYDNQAYGSAVTNFIPGDITIFYDATLNKFVMVGNNANASTSQPTYFYISAGYNDPNVLAAQVNLKIVTEENDFPTIFNGTGQPYKQYKTLNQRLGFTWDGNSRRVPAQNVVGTVSSSYFSLLNRFRPIPAYAPGPSPLPLVSDPSFPLQAISYTAEYPANLVYTSIVNLYANIAGGSTSDSGEVAQALLATVPMASGTLGVVFYNPTIYNALTKISDQIYQITIEMRTENGNLFYLPNSAIVTLEFTLTY